MRLPLSAFAGLQLVRPDFSCRTQSRQMYLLKHAVPAVYGISSQETLTWRALIRASPIHSLPPASTASREGLRISLFVCLPARIKADRGQTTSGLN